MKPSKTLDLNAATEEIIVQLGRDCDLLERFAGEPPIRRGPGYRSRANPIEVMLESLLVKTIIPSRSRPRFSPRELRERSIGRLAQAGFDTPPKRRQLARALVSAGLIRRMTLAWLNATKGGAPAANLGKMFGKHDDGGRIVGLPAYGVELAGQILGSPALLRAYLKSDEQAFLTLMEEGGEAHPALLNMPNLAILFVSLHAKAG